MEFVNTRKIDEKVVAGEAISFGLACGGGLYVPATFPLLEKSDLEKMLDMSYAERTAFTLSKYLTDYDYTNLLKACEKAYSKFDGDPAPLVKIDEGKFILELFHGPTLAFKDMALTLLPYLLREGCNLSGIKEKVLILVATSGDTGKAALEGFKNAEGIDIMVFYPSEGVSKMQKMQMCTQEGDNLKVVAVKGNFDDCQTAVKKIFNDEKIKAELKSQNVVLSSANSINFGRLAPQIAYYFSAYLDLVTGGEIKIGDQVNFAVPTGNFGNILAGYYAKKMGLPIKKLICGSNDNNILTDFFSTGKYDTERPFFKTMSPSMDILISSNLERLLFEISGRDFELTASRMKDLSEDGVYEITDDELENLNEIFYAGCCNEESTVETIYNFFDEYNYPLDTHTAVAVKVCEDYLEETKDKIPQIIVSTANPYKFSSDVLYSITGDEVTDAFKSAKKLFSLTAMPIPKSLSKLKNKPIKFREVKEKDQIYDAVKEFLNRNN